MGEFAGAGVLGLRNLVVVMYGSKVYAAGMDVEGFAQILHRHSRALYVPARKTLAPWAREAEILVKLPKCEVSGISFLGILHPRFRILAQLAQSPVFRVL